MIRLAALTVLLLIPAQDPPKTAYFSGPAGAKESELKEASKALLKRCEAIGWKGMSSEVTTRNGKRLVALTCETGFPLDPPRTGGLTMHRQAERLAHLASLDKFELKIIRPLLTPGERQQFQPGKTPAEDVAPKGTTWVRYHRLHLYGTRPTDAALLLDEPVIRKTKDSKDAANDLVLEQEGFRLKKSAFDRLKKSIESWSEPAEPTMVILIDGLVFDGFPVMGSVRIRKDENPRQPYLLTLPEFPIPGQADAAVVLKHPSPIPLTLLYPGFLSIEGGPDKAGGRGIQITKADPEGAAARAGLKVGDVILSIAGTKTDTLAVLRSVVGKHFEGDEVEVAYLQDGVEKTIKIVLGGRKD